jgi:hypothetical protein
LSKYKTIYNNICNALHDDGAIEAWCQIEYGQSHYVYSGIDIRQPPPSSRCPLIVVFPDDNAYGHMTDDEVYVVLVGFELHDENSETLTGRDRLTKYTAIDNLFDFQQKIEEAVIGADLDGCIVRKVEVSYDPPGHFPYFQGAMLFELMSPDSFDDDPFTYT